MPSYFKSLRRNIGVLTLVLACVLFGGWRRSLHNQDSIHLVYNKARYSIGSVDGRLSFIHVQWLEGPNPIEAGPQLNCIFDPEFRSYDEQGIWNPIESRPSTWELEWRSNWAGFLACSGVITPKGNRVRLNWCMIPYWSIVIPMTLLSTWLLLSKPPKPTPHPSCTNIHSPAQ